MMDAAELGAGAMMDLSDGLASDVRHVCDRSGVGCDVDLALLPVARDTTDLANSLGQDPAILAATGGEDYELLISAPEQILDTLTNTIETCPLTVIGEITQEEVAFRAREKARRRTIRLGPFRLEPDGFHGHTREVRGPSRQPRPHRRDLASGVSTWSCFSNSRLRIS